VCSSSDAHQGDRARSPRDFTSHPPASIRPGLNDKRLTIYHASDTRRSPVDTARRPSRWIGSGIIELSERITERPSENQLLSAANASSPPPPPHPSPPHLAPGPTTFRWRVPLVLNAAHLAWLLARPPSRPVVAIVQQLLHHSRPRDRRVLVLRRPAPASGRPGGAGIHADRRVPFHAGASALARQRGSAGRDALHLLGLRRLLRGIRLPAGGGRVAAGSPPLAPRPGAHAAGQPDGRRRPREPQLVPAGRADRRPAARAGRRPARRSRWTTSAPASPR
jgi:hypothetical protein